MNVQYVCSLENLHSRDPVQDAVRVQEFRTTEELDAEFESKMHKCQMQICIYADCNTIIVPSKKK